MNFGGMRPGVIILREGTDTSQVSSLQMLSSCNSNGGDCTVLWMVRFVDYDIASFFKLLDPICALSIHISRRDNFNLAFALESSYALPHTQ